MKIPTIKLSKHLILFVLSIIITFVSLIHRRPDALSNPQLFAEDGMVFFQEQFNSANPILFKPYAGYILFFPRTITFLSLKLIPYNYVPLVFNIISLLGVLFVVFYIWIRTNFNIYTKFFLGIMITILPAGNEIMFNLTNIQWFLSLLLIVIFISDYSNRFVLLDIFIVLVVGLTGPFCIIFLPAILFSWIHKQKTNKIINKRQHVLYFIFLVPSLIQIFTLIITQERLENKISILDKIITSPQIFYIQFINLLGVAKFYTATTNYPLLFIVGSIIILLLFHCIKIFLKNNQEIPLLLMIACLCVIASYIYSLKYDPSIIHPLFGASRYLFIPMVLILWSFIILFSELANKQYVGILISIYYLYIVIFNIPPLIFEDKRWPYYAAKLNVLQHNEELEVPLNPDGWKMTLKKVK